MPNIKFIKKSKKRAKVGDIFVMKLAEKRFLFGRVVRTDAIIGGFPNCNLLYIYKYISNSKEKIPDLRKEDLLFAPVVTNNQGWLRGFFETIKNMPVESNVYIRFIALKMI